MTLFYFLMKQLFSRNRLEILKQTKGNEKAGQFFNMRRIYIRAIRAFTLMRVTLYVTVGVINCNIVVGYTVMTRRICNNTKINVHPQAAQKILLVL